MGSLELERVGGHLGGRSGKDGRRSESEDWIRGPRALTTILGVVVLSGVATVITPYFYQPYRVFFAKALSPANPYLPETYAPGFRQPQDYVLMLFVMCAFLVLGMRRSRDPLLIGMLVLTTALAFHSRRDIWLVMLAGCAVMGQAGAKETGGSQAESSLSVGRLVGREFWIAVGAAVAIVVLGAVILVPHGEQAYYRLRPTIAMMPLSK